MKRSCGATENQEHEKETTITLTWHERDFIRERKESTSERAFKMGPACMRNSTASFGTSSGGGQPSSLRDKLLGEEMLKQ